MKYYKVLKSDGRCAHGGTGKWYLPKKQKDGSWKAGKWMPEIKGELELCKKGYHICRPDEVVYWLDEAIFEVEYDGEIVEGFDKCVVRKARLLRKIEAWEEINAPLLATDGVEHVLCLCFPDDDRPRKVITSSARFCEREDRGSWV